MKAKKRKNPLHTKVKDLPASLQNALKSVGYGRADIALDGAADFTFHSTADDNQKAFVMVVNMGTGDHQIAWGTYGSGNAKNQVDNDRAYYPIPVNGAVIKGVTGGGHPVYATLTVSTANMAAMLPPEVELSAGARKALKAIDGYTSKGRVDEFEYQNLGRYGVDNPLVRELAAKGLIKITASGAISVTTEGKSTRSNPRTANPAVRAPSSRPRAVAKAKALKAPRIAFRKERKNYYASVPEFNLGIQIVARDASGGHYLRPGFDVILRGSQDPVGLRYLGRPFSEDRQNVTTDQFKTHTFPTLNAAKYAARVLLGTLRTTDYGRDFAKRNPRSFSAPSRREILAQSRAQSGYDTITRYAPILSARLVRGLRPDVTPPPKMKRPGADERRTRGSAWLESLKNPKKRGSK